MCKLCRVKCQRPDSRTGDGLLVASLPYTTFFDTTFAAATFGKWWGTDPIARKQADVDAVAADIDRSYMLAGECTWRNSFDETEIIRLLERRAAIFTGNAKVTYALFMKLKVSDGIARKAKDRKDFLLMDAERMFSI